jgi:hypothetical protein
MNITIFSDALYAKLRGYKLEGFQGEIVGQERTVNGLVLLKHYLFLKDQTDTLRCAESPEYPTAQTLLLEMELLVDGLLADGEVFKSFGYEELYERKVLDFKLWKKFQLDKFERDLSEIEEDFYEIDEEEDEYPLVKAAEAENKAAEAESKVREAKLKAWEAELKALKAELTALGAETKAHAAKLKALEAENKASCFKRQLVEAAKAGHEATVPELLDRGASIDDALVASADLGQMSTMQQFLNWGADINAVTRFGTALSAAAKTDNGRMVRWLLRQGAEVGIAACILQSSGQSKSKVAWLCRLASSVRNSTYFGKMGRLYQNPERAQKFRILHGKFVHQYVLMTNAAQRSSTTFRELGRIFQGHRDTWEASIRTVRSMARGERPTLANTIAYLCFVKAISDTLKSDTTCDYTEPFFQDLARWELLFTQGSDRDAYRDVIYSMWGVALNEKMSSEGQVDCDVTMRFFSLASTLISDASEHFDLDRLNRGFERSQHAWQSRNNQISSDADSDIESRNHISFFQVSKASGQQASEIKDAKPPDPDLDIGSKLGTLRQTIHHDKSAVPDSVVIFLMMGAAFSIVVIFLQCLLSQTST